MRIFNSRFFTSATVAGAAFVLALSPFGLSVAQDEDLSISSVVPAAEVSIGAQYIDVDPNVKFDRAVLRVAGPDGYALTRTVSAEKGASYITADLLFDAEPARQGNFEEPLPWNHLPDGKYYFEIQFYSPDGSTERQSGSFKVEGGTARSRDQDSLSATHRNSVIERIAGTVLDWLMPSAHAQSTESHGTTGDFDDFVSIRNVSGAGKSRLNLNTTDSLTINADTWRVANDADSNRFEIIEGSNTNRLVILQGGNVGIGTDAPLNQLHVHDDGGFQIRLTDGSMMTRLDTFSNRFAIYGANSRQFSVHNNAPTDSLVVGSGGNIGIGTAAPLTPLHVGSGTTVPRLNASTIMAQQTGDTGLTFRADAKGVEVFLLAEGSTATPRGIFGTLDPFPFEIRTNNQNRMWIAANGNIGIGGVNNPSHPIAHANGAILTSGGAWQDASSRELKKNISELQLEDARNAIMELKPVRFEYKIDANDERIGFIAEDVPELVAAADRKSLSSMEIVAAMVQVVQDQQNQIENLRFTLEELRNSN